MQKLYLSVLAALCTCYLLPTEIKAQAQDCSLTATFKAFESRCTATGAIKVKPIGGSGSYQYKVTGPVSSNFTSVDSITGLSAGVYTVEVNDIALGCSFIGTNIIVPGTYKDPRFTLQSIDVSCDNGSNGSISLTTLIGGRGPFLFSIQAPSTMGIGLVSQTGNFRNLRAGSYTIRLVDSCGGVQTRLISINNYKWWIDSYQFTKFTCDSVRGSIKVIDSKGNISTAGGVPNMTYGVVRSPGDTIWSTNPNFTFNLGVPNTFEIIAKDKCGIIKKAPVTVNFSPSVGIPVNTYNLTCNSFSVSLTNIVNFFNPNFCLYDSSDVQIACNNTGTFDNLAYGTYCIRAIDGCSNTVIKRCFTISPPPISIGGNVTIKDRICNSFTAEINNQIGLTNPTFCLYDSAGTLITCNSSGTFTNLAYSNYCIVMKDGCRDTSITRCFSATRPIPEIPDQIIPLYYTCTVFGIDVNGNNLTSPRFCLRDSAGIEITCNGTGVFDSIPYGNYCVSVYDSCYDTTITRCILIGGPFVQNTVNINISNKACSTFTAQATSTNIINPNYCLYNSNDSLLTCDSSGTFNNLPYGRYCIKTIAQCPDTSFTNCFTAGPPLPVANSNVSISNKTCTDFTVTLSGIQNLLNVNYCLIKNSTDTIRCNTTGIFNNIPYGSYCIKVRGDCYDTTISRCFSASPTPVRLNVSSQTSCNYGFAKLVIGVSGGNLPVSVKVYNPTGTLNVSLNYIGNSLTVDNLPGTTGSQTFKIVATDICGNKDSIFSRTRPSAFSRNVAITKKCPSAIWQNGSGDIRITASATSGAISVRIVRKNGVILSPSRGPNTASGGVFTYTDIEPATYIIQYKISDNCNKLLYDTVRIPTYQFPTLDRSSAYQCDIGGFSLGAVVSNGVGPYRYEIIGSTPAFPSIISPPQLSPVFTINNNTNYTLVRLRVLDACGNASLEDASILPLANNGITANFNCMQRSSTIRVDTIFNSTYTWYKKTTLNSTDSVFKGNGYNVFIPTVLPADTGWYICNITVNNGCIKRRFLFNLNGACANILPINVTDFKGSYIGDKVQLNWNATRATDLNKFVVERKNLNNIFVTVGEVNPSASIESGILYNFIDANPLPGNNFYRLRMQYKNASVTYSNIIQLSKMPRIGNSITVFPNPASNIVNINFGAANNHVYKIKLMNIDSKVINETTFINAGNNNLPIEKAKNMGNGIYIIGILDTNTNEYYFQKIIFQ